LIAIVKCFAVNLNVIDEQTIIRFFTTIFTVSLGISVLVIGIYSTDFYHLSSYHNVLFTGYLALLTEETLMNISETTLMSLLQLSKGEACSNRL